ncbi:MAG: archease [Nitrospirota bacterium]
MEKYTVLDISGDVGLRAFGRSSKEAFVNAAAGMYSLITDPDFIKEKETVTPAVESHSLDGLLVSWLNELIFHFDAYGFIGKTIHINELVCEDGQPESEQTCRLTAVISGEKFDPERHDGKLLIKAATYHMLRVEKPADIWEIDVIFDI